MFYETELTDDDRRLLNRPINGQGGFQTLLRRLQECCNEDWTRITVDAQLYERIRRYTANYGSGGFQGRLRSLAERLTLVA